MTTISVGAKASIKKAFSSDELEAFAKLSKDFNPIHLDEEAGKNSIFKQRVVHGALVNSLFSGLLGCELPGEGTIFIEQTIKFKAPVFLDQEIEAFVEITNIREDKPVITLRTYALNDEGTIVIDGVAIILFPGLKS
ncbi:MAG: MaoC family dehydratase [Gammaproteobacteria bacterium]|nr:MaoC family dehydratase [Gammaproteobacteria bacterium]